MINPYRGHFMADLNTVVKPVAAITQELVSWNNNWNWNFIKLALFTSVLITAVVLLFVFGRLSEIGNNFSRYRCNPLFMPFAGNFGYDTKDNFNFCISNIFRGKAAEVFGPIYSLLGGFTQIIQLIVDVTLGIRKLFSNFLLGVNGFIANVRDRIQGLLFQIRLSFMKMNHLMGRVYGTMYSVVWMGTSAITAGFNIADNDLVKFLFEFCFDPTTPVAMADGSIKTCGDLEIGDKLAPVAGHTPLVTSTFRFDGRKTRMVKLHGVTLSAEHYVSGPSGWIPAAQHPEASPAPSLDKIVCVNVTGHKFHVGTSKLLVADYDEHSDPKTISETQHTAQRALNGTDLSGNVVYDYSLGIHADTNVRMADNSWKQISSIQLGDTVYNSGKVLGLVQEYAGSAINIDGIIYSASQLVYDVEQGLWIRAAEHTHAQSCASHIVYSLITERCGTLEIRGASQKTYYIRDYREVALPEMEDAYSAAFLVGN
jgi:hypothetical protein